MTSDSRHVSIADMVALLTAVGGVIYTSAVVNTRVADNGKDIEAAKTWISKHGQMDREAEEREQAQFSEINKNLYKIIGKLDEQDKERKGGR